MLNHVPMISNVPSWVRDDWSKPDHSTPRTQVDAVYHKPAKPNQSIHERRNLICGTFHYMFLPVKLACLSGVKCGAWRAPKQGENSATSLYVFESKHESKHGKTVIYPGVEARTLLGAPGLLGARTLLGAKGLTTRSKDATRSKGPYY